ncbi:curlin repeat-containing protein [Siphonobacter sp. BAB-5405]|uniref:curlin repeat-containing protein n=1 Tax=Siphonobacter sp. BAB-5405 TaxID=1864825 RepID=UPI0011AF6591|nr:curlin repeat-containing protein [Siphonobacter sp. BAB-5405]
MRVVILSSFAMLTTMSCLGQNRVSISQSGDGGNTASITQTGVGNQVSINQQSGGVGGSNKAGNRLKVKTPRGTKTHIIQGGNGPNLVEISQEGQASAHIQQLPDSTSRIEILPTEPEKPKTPKDHKRP